MTTITNLSEELVEHILSKVPITSIRAVRSTLKQWNVLSKTKVLCEVEPSQQFTMFMVMDHKFFSMRFNIHGILNKDDGTEDFVDPLIKEIGEPLNQLDISKVFHCNGLLLCPTRDHSTLLVWNPYLGQTRLIIQPEERYDEHDKFALGYDENKNHKILRFYDDYDKYQFYDFESNSWGEDDVVPEWDIDCYNRGATVNGNLYFLTREKHVRRVKDRVDFLLSFDLTTEKEEYLRMPFQYRRDHTMTLSSVKEEKLVALYQREKTYTMEIWVTTEVKPSKVLWNNLFKVDMKPLIRCGFKFTEEAGNFFIDEEKKVAVVFNLDITEAEKWANEHFYHTAYIVGEKGLLKKVVLGEAVKMKEGVWPSPLVCTSPYVPSLVRINQVAGLQNNANPGLKRILKRKTRG